MVSGPSSKGSVRDKHGGHSHAVSHVCLRHRRHSWSDADSFTDTHTNCLSNNTTQPDTHAHGFTDRNAYSNKHTQPDSDGNSDYSTQPDTITHSQLDAHSYSGCSEADQETHKDPNTIASPCAVEPCRRADIFVR